MVARCRERYNFKGGYGGDDGITTKQWKYAANTIAAGALALVSCMHCPELQYIS